MNSSLLNLYSKYGECDFTVQEAYQLIKKHKRYRSELDKRTEISSQNGETDDFMYFLIFAKIFKVRNIRLFHRVKGKARFPTMRICLDRKGWKRVYRQNDRIIFHVEIVGVPTSVSFDISEFAQYILLADEEVLDTPTLREVMQYYLDYIYKQIKTISPYERMRKRDFYISSYKNYEETRVMMSKIIAFYMGVISKKMKKGVVGKYV